MATKQSSKKPLTKGGAKVVYNKLRTFKKEFVLSQGDGAEVTPLERKCDDLINELSKFINGE